MFDYDPIDQDEFGQPHRFILKEDVFYPNYPEDEVIAWCQGQFGYGGTSKRWSCSPGGRFYFLSGLDALVFRMRWC
jgi:hypothetical protein